jgi:hypothetical protein
MQRQRGMTLVVALAAAVSGCSASSAKSNPAVKLCGHTVDAKNAGAAIVHAERGGQLRVTGVGPAGTVFVTLSKDCAHGATVRYVPPQAVREVFSIPTTDGRLAGVVIGVLAKRTTVLIQHADGSTTNIKFELSRVPQCHGPAC